MIAVHSYNSLCYGTMPIADLVTKAAAMGYDALPLTDINTTMGAVDFVVECQRKGVRPVVGVEVRNGNEMLYVALAKNNAGFAELNRFLTQHNLSKQPYPETAPEWEHVFVIYPFGKRKPNTLKENEFLGVRFSQLTKMYNCQSFEKLVAMQPVTFAEEADFQLYQSLRAIDENVLISRLEPAACAAPDEILLSADRLKTTFALYPQLIENAERILDECEINLDNSVKNKRTYTGNAYDDLELLRQKAFEGMIYRYGTRNKTAYRRIEKELDIIEKMGFCAYFLIAWDIVRYAMSQGFYHVGRGSGANSIVAYCLKITDVDPIELDLYFERFLNPKRSSPPDFDLDFSWRDRDKVIEYIFKKYGQDHVALLGATVTFQDNSLCRELGKVFGLPKGEIDQMERNPEAFACQSELGRHILALAERLRDFPRQRSIHAIASMDYRFRMMERPFKFSADLYYKALSNLVPYSVNNVQVIYYGDNRANGHAMGLDLKLFGEFVPGADSWLTLSVMDTKMKLNGKSIPLPTDQRFAVNMFFTDYFPGTTRWKMSLKLAYADGLPFSAPHRELEKNSFRAPAYKRVDMGMSYRLLDNEDRSRKSIFKNIWLGVDALNLLGINNVNSYYWITDVTSQQYAVPNYLTGRQINGRVLFEF